MGDFKIYVELEICSEWKTKPHPDGRLGALKLTLNTPTAGV